MNDLQAVGLNTLTGSPTWCTFVLPNGLDEPFLPPVNTAPAIHNALGLDLSVAGRELLLFFSRASAYILQKPTVADAGLHPYFTPAGKRYDHGWTTPHDRAITGGAPQPEGVHAPLKTTPLLLKMILT